MYNLEDLPENLTYEMIRIIPDLPQAILFEAQFSTDLKAMAYKYHTKPEDISLLIEEYKESWSHYWEYRKKRMADKMFECAERMQDAITDEKIQNSSMRDIVSAQAILIEKSNLLRGEATSKNVVEVAVVNKELAKLPNGEKDAVIRALQELESGAADNNPSGA